MEIPKNFNLNMFKDVLIPSLKSNIRTDKRTLGASDNPWGIRKNVLKNLHGLEVPLNNKMLIGIMYENVLSIRKVLRRLFLMYNKLINLPIPKVNYEEVVNKEDFMEPFPNKFPEYLVRMHPDHHYVASTMEIKVTAVYIAQFINKLAPYQVCQENIYINYYEHPFGFLHKLNIRAFINKFTSWEELWQKYGFIIPIYRDKDFYELSMERFEYMFEKIDTKDTYCSCPEQIFECQDCITKHLCKNPIKKEYIEFEEKCFHCKQPIELTKKASGEMSALCYSRNGKFYHGNDKRDPDKWSECHKACVEDWRWDGDE